MDNAECKPNMQVVQEGAFPKKKLKSVTSVRAHKCKLTVSVISSCCNTFPAPPPPCLLPCPLPPAIRHRNVWLYTPSNSHEPHAGASYCLLESMFLTSPSIGTGNDTGSRTLNKNYI